MLRGGRDELQRQSDEPDRLGGEIDADEPLAGGRRVALGENEVQHAQHAVQALGQLIEGWDSVGDARVRDAPLRPCDPLRHRRLRDEERAGDLCGREARDGAQCQCHPAFERQRRVRAREDESQPVVGILIPCPCDEVCHIRGERPAGQLIHRAHLLELASLVRRAPDPIERGVARDGGDPRAGVRRKPVERPHSGGLLEGVLRGILRETPVPGDADECHDDARPLVPVSARQRIIDAQSVPPAPGSRGQKGRSSSEPQRAIGCFDATSIASSRSRQWRMSKPPIHSFASM